MDYRVPNHRVQINDLQMFFRVSLPSGCNCSHRKQKFFWKKVISPNAVKTDTLYTFLNNFLGSRNEHVEPLYLYGLGNVFFGKNHCFPFEKSLSIASDLILLDEPTSNLDAANSKIITKAIRSFCATKNIIMTSHNVNIRNQNDHVIELV